MILRFFFLSFFFLSTLLYGECKGRLDIGPAYVKIDSLNSGKTVKSFDLKAFKGDFSYSIYKGLCLKGGGLIAEGRAELTTFNLGIGYCIPCHPQLTLTPYLGVSQTRFSSRMNLEEFSLYNLKEKFVSYGGYLGLDAVFTIVPSFRIYGIFQYSWSKVKTKIIPILTSHDKSQGPNYGLVLEKDLNPNFSLNLGVGYNLSLTKEKHGLRGAGIKLGTVFWF